MPELHHILPTSLAFLLLVTYLYFYPSNYYEEYFYTLGESSYQTNIHLIDDFIDPKILADLDTFENEDKFEKEEQLSKEELGKIPQNHTNVIVFEPLTDLQISKEEDIQKERLALLNAECLKRKIQNLPDYAIYSPMKVHHTFQPCADIPVKNQFTYCIPLKTGTTNIQRLLVRNTCSNLTEAKLSVPGIFYQLPRLSDYLRKTKNNARNYEPVKEILHSDIGHALNVRHPFARLASAYRQKFETKFYKKNFKMYKSYGKIMQKYDQLSGRNYTSEDKFIASFESFLVMIAESDPKNYNIHWKTFEQTCGPCQHNYNFISKTETADLDSQYFAEKFIGVSTAVDTAYGGSTFYSKGMYEGLPKQLIDTIYAIYRRDFEMFGYSLEDSF